MGPRFLIRPPAPPARAKRRVVNDKYAPEIRRLYD